MPASKKKQDYNNKYAKEHYSRIAVLVPPEWKPVINERAHAAGLSVNAWVNRAIAARIAQETTGQQQENAQENTD